MINRTSKGNRTVNKCVEMLRAQGLMCEAVERKGRYRKQKDVFGFIDVIAWGKAMQDGEAPRYYIQCKTNSWGRKEEKGYISRMAMEYLGFNEHIEVWRWDDYGKFRVRRFFSSGAYEDGEPENPDRLLTREGKGESKRVSLFN